MFYQKEHTKILCFIFGCIAAIIFWQYMYFLLYQSL